MMVRKKKIDQKVNFQIPGEKGGGGGTTGFLSVGKILIDKNIVQTLQLFDQYLGKKYKKEKLY